MKLITVEDSDKVMVRDNDKFIYVLFLIDLSQSCQLIFFFFFFFLFTVQVLELSFAMI